MKRTMASLVVLALALCAVGARADVPSVINYQGYLTSPPPANAPVQGQRELRFSVYDDPAAGSLIWQEVHPYIDVERGVFEVWLGTGGNPLFDRHFETSNSWLQIEVRDIDSPGDPYEIISPRNRLATTPYAFRVATVDSASGGTIKGDIEIKNGRLGIGTASPDEQLDVVGNMLVDGKAAIGPGHINTGSFSFVAGENNEASGQFSTVGGGSHNVASGDYATIPGGFNNEASNSYSLASGCRAKANHDGTFVWADQSVTDFASTGENQFLVRASGGVGIGTNEPQANLHIGGTPGVDGIMFPDGTLQTTAASTGSEITVVTGTASHDALISPPSGYTMEQCKIIVSPHTSGPSGSSQEAYRHWCYVTPEAGGWRVRAQSQNAHYGGMDNDIANYMIIGVK